MNGCSTERVRRYRQRQREAEHKRNALFIGSKTHLMVGSIGAPLCTLHPHFCALSRAFLLLISRFMH